MLQQYRCKYCHASVHPNDQHVCESTSGVHDEDDFLEAVPATSVASGNEQDAWDDGDDLPSTEEDHDREFD